MPSISEKFRTIAENLLNLEINTIVTDQISGQKMSQPEHALIDIADTYRSFFDVLISKCGTNRLREIRKAREANANGYADREKLKGAGDWNDWPCLVEIRSQASFKVFNWFGILAQNLLAVRGDLEKEKVGLTTAQENLLNRIWNNSDQLKGVFGRLKSTGSLLSRAEAPATSDKAPLTPLRQIELAPEDIVLIRKVWEIGLDVIEAQTVIQLDGDVVTRIRQDILGDRKRMEDILTIHNRAVDTSIGFWKSLVGVIGSFLNGVAQLVFPESK
jgi:hypothetical protein